MRRGGIEHRALGALKVANLDTLVRINPDIVGVRGAVCTRGDREAGNVAASAVAALRDELQQRLTGKIDVFAEADAPRIPW